MRRGIGERSTSSCLLTSTRRITDLSSKVNVPGRNLLSGPMLVTLLPKYTWADMRRGMGERSASADARNIAPDKKTAHYKSRIHYKSIFRNHYRSIILVWVVHRSIVLVWVVGSFRYSLRRTLLTLFRMGRSRKRFPLSRRPEYRA